MYYCGYMLMNTGKIGEHLVSRWLSLNGHSVLERGSRVGNLELDLYTKDALGVFHLIEVKSSAAKICSCMSFRFTISEKVRCLLPERFISSWRIRELVSEASPTSVIDRRFNAQKLFHMKLLAQAKEGTEPSLSRFSIDYARVELCFLHKVGIITLFGNIEL